MNEWRTGGLDIVWYKVCVTIRQLQAQTLRFVYNTIHSRIIPYTTPAIPFLLPLNLLIFPPTNLSSLTPAQPPHFPSYQPFHSYSRSTSSFSLLPTFPFLLPLHFLIFLLPASPFSFFSFFSSSFASSFFSVSSFSSFSLSFSFSLLAPPISPPPFSHPSSPSFPPLFPALFPSSSQSLLFLLLL